MLDLPHDFPVFPIGQLLSTLQRSHFPRKANAVFNSEHPFSINKMMWALETLGALVILAPLANAFIRLPCSNLVTQRFDPFDLAMDPDVDIGETATCTTCRFKEDKSNYWTAVMYFKHPNGSYFRVPQMANHNTGPGLQAGGMTVYYFQPVPPTRNLTIVPFAKGFRMLVGNPMRRTNDIPSHLTEARATTFRCFQGSDPGSIGAPGGDEDSFEFPDRPCTGGIRSNIYFPQCWNGVDLDPPDHQSHVAHPIGGFFGTDCPDSHPVRLPLLFIEIVWDTRPFNDPSFWENGQPFVFSMGDPTGYGQHADYVFGWEGDSLKRAMDVCTSFDGIPANCPALTIQDMDTMNNCRLPVKVPEPVEDVYLDALPGCNPIQAGPEPATMVPSCDAVSTTVDAPMPTASPNVVIPPWPVCWDGPGEDPSGLTPKCDPPKSPKRSLPRRGLEARVTPAPL
ncbi:hypothetical protein CC1G_05556 [Coprinopsis cinerea okayama7|uniref:DUF1996 domain-containing protein n=1 Tax=Coprinopsis cinerea (strain Okayama-7 / 130 / ATCC MYA-4618 / FGSC 9003) TaxID=240176 RepID=A8P1D7_COPC7|nr:hypothetical protein CC1G_05556 [Coprinopsis cinerea okayama7\|eukprot:XP_001838075.2 hypothetical protein CC1G_05556 [Coprinopsis cinerea okayama7\